jgi:outer membrane lipoprotein-sorting protein
MIKTNPLLTFLLLGMAACACAAGHGKDQSEAERARQLILKTLQRTFSQNVIAIIKQRAPENHGSVQRIHVQISSDGKMRQTVIYPLSSQGMETIDDGKLNSTYLPDEKLMLIQESPQLLPNDTLTRINLTVRNYGLALGGTSNIAGLKASIVIATPRHKSLETRRYYIDDRTGFLLQLETVDNTGVVKQAFKAEKVIYPSRISPSTFEIDTEGTDGRKIVYRRRVGLFNGQKGTPSLGFEPCLPSELPFGFDVQDAQINDSGKYQSVAVRITDGLVKGTIYQYSLATAKRMRVMAGTSVEEGAGIQFVIYADVPEAVRKRILAAFVEAAKKAASDNPTLGIWGRTELLPEYPALSRETVQALEIRQLSLFAAIPL